MSQALEIGNLQRQMKILGNPEDNGELQLGSGDVSMNASGSMIKSGFRTKLMPTHKIQQQQQIIQADESEDLNNPQETTNLQTQSRFGF